MTTTATTNHAARRSLASLIDRLDGILDGLAEAVGGGVGQAVREAVEATVREVLASPTLLRAALHAHRPAPSPAAPEAKVRPSPAQALRNWLARAWQAAKQTAVAAGGAVA